jgi:DNA repair protein RadA/Sms
MEGTRPLLCEIQALAVQTPMPMPRRTALGVDLNRLHLIIAVLEKHGGAKLYNQDIFINIVGGLKIDEPSVDLAIAAALVSSLRQQELDPQTVYLGEIGLTGEVRAVSFIEQRIKESIKLGFTRFVLPASNRKAILDLDPGQIKPDVLKKIRFLKNIGELLGDRQSRSLDL